VLSVAAWSSPDFNAFVVDASAFRTQPWRWLSSTLVHVNVIHLAFNLYWMWIFGRALESEFARPAIAGLYVLLALISGAAQYALDWSGVGLSGVVYGLFGFLWVLARRDPKWLVLVDKRTTWAFVGWFFLCIATTATGILRVGNVAHIFGGIAGACIGRAVSTRSSQRKRWIVGTAALTGIVMVSAAFARPLINPTESVGYELADRAYRALDRHRYSEAEVGFRRAIERTGGVWEWHYDLGVACWYLAKFEEAAAAYRRAHELAPFESNPRVELARTLSMLAYQANGAGNTTKARTLYRESVDLDDSRATVWANLALAYAVLGDHSMADKSIERAIAIDPAADGVEEARKWLEWNKSR
jgi:GlpG protein